MIHYGLAAFWRGQDDSRRVLILSVALAVLSPLATIIAALDSLGHACLAMYLGGLVTQNAHFWRRHVLQISFQILVEALDVVAAGHTLMIAQLKSST